MSQPVPIGIAVVEHAGKYLVGIRGPNGPLPGKAEFPGGKCHAGESARDCAVRECAEEAGLTVEPVSLLLERRFEYPHATVELAFWLCRPLDPVAAEHNGFRWVAPGELATLDFPEANLQLVRQLCGGAKDA
jgi:mutator protein MutT